MFSTDLIPSTWPSPTFQPGPRTVHCLVSEAPCARRAAGLTCRDKTGATLRGKPRFFPHESWGMLGLVPELPEDLGKLMENWLRTSEFSSQHTDHVCWLAAAKGSSLCWQPDIAKWASSATWLRASESLGCFSSCSSSNKPSWHKCASRRRSASKHPWAPIYWRNTL